MKKRCRWLCWLLCIVTIAVSVVEPVYAADNNTFSVLEQIADKPEEYQSAIMWNPFYEDVLDKGAILAERESTQGAVDFSTWSLVRSEQVCDTLTAAQEYLKCQMVNRQGSISFLYPQAAIDIDVLGEMFEGAMEYSDSCAGAEGDALRFEYTSCQYGYAYASDQYARVTFTMTYYTSAEQQETLATSIDQAMQELELDGVSEYDKIVAIYNYIGNHVDYDYTSTDDLKYTAYAALCNGTAVCQGYAVLFYRMCKEADLSVRIIAGTGNGGPHAWNIVRIGNYYYNVDSTWDGQDAETYDNYLLKNETDFGGHIRSSIYDTTEFHAAYPMAQESWIDNSKFTDPVNASNTEYTFRKIDGTTATSTAQGKPRLLIFYNTECYYSQSTISNISNNISQFSEVDILAIDVMQHTSEEVNGFKQTYGCDKIEFAYDTASGNSSTMWNYVGMLGMGSSIYFPVIIYIDADNKIQYGTSGMTSAGEVATNLAYYCSRTLELSTNNLNMKPEDAMRVVGYVDGIQRSGSLFKWTSSNPAVAIVDDTGTVTAVSVGNCTITCTLNANKSKTVDVTVSQTAQAPAVTVYNGVDYAAVYDFDYYINANADLKAGYGNNSEGALAHFVNHGMAEGRQAKEDFNVHTYRNRYSDLRRGLGTNLKQYFLHYINHGMAEGRSGAGTATLVPITSYNGVDYSAVYDYAYYTSRYPDLKSTYSGDDYQILKHFVEYGMAAGYQGSEEFNVYTYKNRYQDLRRGLGNDLKSYFMHYINHGKSEGRSGAGTAQFVGETIYNGVDYAAVYDYNFYVSKYPDLERGYNGDEAAILQHFVECGMAEGRQGSAEFDVLAYMYRYEDLYAGYGNNLKGYYLHYLQAGKAEGRNGAPFTTAEFTGVYDFTTYMSMNQDLSNAFGTDQASALKHFAMHGMNEGRQASEEFNVYAYINRYPDLRAGYGNDLKEYYLHYANAGKAEGRNGRVATVAALALESVLEVVPETEVMQEEEKAPETEVMQEEEKAPETEVMQEEEKAPETEVMPETEKLPEVEEGIKTEVVPETEVGPEAETETEQESQAEAKPEAEQDTEQVSGI